MRIPAMRNFVSPVALIAALAVAVSATSRAQTVSSPPQFGIVPSGSYQNYHVDSVNMDTGNDIIQIPLFSLPQLGELSLGFSAVSNTTAWQEGESCTPDGTNCEDYYAAYNPTYAGQPLGYPGVQIGPVIVPNDMPESVWISQTIENCQTPPPYPPGTPGDCENYIYLDRSVADSTGGSHPLFYDQSNPSQLRSTDGSGYLLYTNVSDPYNYESDFTNWTIVDPKGIETTETSGSGGDYTITESDPDNNTITYSYAGALGEGQFTDSAQRPPIPDVPSQSNATSSTAGCPNLNLQYQPVVGSYAWTVPGPNNTSSTYLVCYTQVYYHTDFFDNGGQNQAIVNGDTTTAEEEAVGSTWAVQSIVLPNQTSYWGFAYDAANPNDSSSIAYGTLTQLIFPEGGSITYSYAFRPGCYSETADAVANVPILASRTVTDLEGHSYLWSYDLNDYYAPGGPGNVVTDPNGNDTVYTFQSAPWPPVVNCNDLETTRTLYQGSHLAGSPTVVQSVQSAYQTVEAPQPYMSQVPVGYGNAFLLSRTTTLNGSVSTTSSTTPSVADFTASAPSCFVQESSPCTIIPGISATLSLSLPIGRSVTDYSGSGIKTTATAYEWQSNSNYFSANLLDTPSQVSTYDGSGTLAAQTTTTYDETAYSPGGVRGHPTTASMWVGASSGPSVSHTGWNANGEEIYTIDADGHANGNGHTIDYTYGTQYNGLYPTTVTNALNQATRYTYDMNTGKIASVTDPNSETTSYLFDSMGRVTTTNYPDGGQVAVDYHGDPTPPVATVTTTADPDPARVRTSLYDGLGRAVETQLTSDPSGTDYVDTTYDGLDRVVSVSNPYRSTEDPTYGSFQYTYDVLGRKVTQCHLPDWDCARWTYVGNETEYQDPAYILTDWFDDPLGRMTQFLEPNSTDVPTVPTNYAYDALGNLTSVTQEGVSGETPRVRGFTYDGLSRLISAINPETGTVSYAYDGNGNVISRTDARGIVTTYSYDALNRLTAKSYANDPQNTPSVGYVYDAVNPVVIGGPNAMGRLSQVVTFLGTSVLTNRLSLGYDAMGRDYGYAECRGTSSTGCDGEPVAIGFNPQFDLAGNPLAEAGGYIQGSGAGSASTTSLSYDGAGNPSEVKSQFELNSSSSSSQYTLLADPAYTVFGALSAANLSLDANNNPQIWLVRSYDTRLRPTGETDTAVASQAQLYNYSLTMDPDGDATGASDSVIGTWSYAPGPEHQLLDLVASAGYYNGASLHFHYDSFGNRTALYSVGDSQAPVPVSATFHYNANNQLTSGALYDAAGDVTDDGTNRYLYDAEGRLCAAQSDFTLAMTGYLYDGLGNRVAKGTITTFSCDMTSNGFIATSSYAVGSNGEQLEEVDGAGNPVHMNVFDGGQLLATYTADGNLHYDLNDWVGTKRVQVSVAGAIEESCTSLPFGEELNCTPSAQDATDLHFTGKERDSESGNDYFDARYYGSTMGRFLSPDPLGGHLEYPQSLNKYAYVMNNPLTLTDPTGLDIWLQGCGKDSSTCKGNYVGTTDKNGNFTRTHLTGDQTKDATLGPHGISVTQDGKTYSGVWDTNKGENGTVTVADVGALKGYNADVNGNCGGTCVASGEIKSADPHAGNVTQALFGALNAKDSEYVRNAGTDWMNFFHPGATNFRGHTSGDPHGIPSTHIPIDPKASLPNNEWHIDRTYPYDSTGDWLEHAGCATHTSCNPQQ